VAFRVSVNYLLDTCGLIWLVNGAAELSSGARAACGQPGIVLCVSAISSWEMALKQARKKLSLQKPLLEWWAEAIARHALVELPISAKIAIRSVELESIHGDPADRLLIATAQEHGLTLLTPDPVIAKYSNLNVLW
jgi:PIN domain nuclease of toxin-antitoxin system